MTLARAYDLSTGKYDVEVKAGPSYTTQREETRELLIEIIRALPQAAPYIADQLFAHMDFVGADTLAERARALLPQSIQQMEAKGMQDQLAGASDEIKGLFAQGMQRIQQLQQQVQQLQPEAVEARAKQREMELREFELQSNREIKLTELRLKERELRIKEAELGIAATEAVTAAQTGAAPVAP